MDATHIGSIIHEDTHMDKDNTQGSQIYMGKVFVTTINRYIYVDC